MLRERFRTWTWLWIALASASLLVSCAEQAPPEREPLVRPVKTLVVGVSDDAGLSFPALVRALNRVDASFRVGGRLIEFPVRDEFVVRRGQLIARIDPRDFRIRLDAARATHQRAEADFRRFSALYEREAVSEAQLDQARAALDLAKASLEDAQSALEDTQLRAPFSGRVGERFVENFEVVRPNQPIVRLIDISSVEVVYDAPENLMATLSGAAGGRFVARFAAAPGREYELRLKEVASQADPRTQTFRVTFTMRQPEELNVLPGMTAIVQRDAIRSNNEGIVVVPAVSVVSDEVGNANVWVVDTNGMTVTRRRVTTGALAGTDGIQIVDGLTQGETIVVTGVHQLREGDQIRRLSNLEVYER